MHFAFRSPRWSKQQSNNTKLFPTDIISGLSNDITIFWSMSIDDKFSCMFARLRESFSKSLRCRNPAGFVASLEPTTARYTRSFSTIWVWIDFYLSRRIQKKQFFGFWRHLEGIFLTIWVPFRCVF